ncbi:hypothetical protein PVK63_19325 [Aliivibrio sp. S2TY2]|uniref:hypothetical protein n=1 Tax=Aliivibrio TaxID=511678 RepID=UPI0013EA4FE9|nr:MULTISPECIES: hypothetical protein [Aliivibrio]MDD9177061.1 hypothetical protein [Aliivibrio sp. S3TY1]MDD9194100.1 hypothetical protein [Aliivibrio sp. S2TY2]
MPYNDYSELKLEKSQRQKRYAQHVALSNSSAANNSRGSSFGSVRRSNNVLLRPSFL